jgi:hypothetical protein
MHPLTEAELKRLAHLSKELGETQQVIGKILNSGYGLYHREDLAREIGHVENAISLLMLYNDIDSAVVHRSSCNGSKVRYEY